MRSTLGAFSKLPSRLHVQWRIVLQIALLLFFPETLLTHLFNTGWCGAGADHYEPLIAHPSAPVSQEKVAFVL